MDSVSCDKEEEMREIVTWMIIMVAGSENQMFRKLVIDTCLH